jgi:hypothetical protein
MDVSLNIEKDFVCENLLSDRRSQPDLSLYLSPWGPSGGTANRNTIRIPSTASPGESKWSYSAYAQASADYNIINCGIGESDMCLCNTEPMTVDHVLTTCLNLATPREEMWPNGTSPGATVWQPGAAPPDDNVYYCGRTVYLRTQKKKYQSYCRTQRRRR